MTSTIIDFPTPVLQRLKPANLAATAQLLQQSWHTAHAELMPTDVVAQHTLAYFQDKLQQQVDKAWLLLFRDEVVGYCEHRLNCIDELWIAAAYQRKGFASLLLAQALQEIAAKNYNHAVVGCLKNSPGAQFFAQHHGWQRLETAQQKVAPEKIVEIEVYTHSV